jgi:serine/threonine-protein kinase
VKVATFACSLVAHGDEARPHPGDTAYLAPERIARNRYDARADVYSAGVLLFELLYGRACYSEHRAREVAAMVVHSGMPLEKLEREGVPKGLIEVVGRATERRPELRYQSASSMARDLLRWLEVAEHHATPSTVAKFFDRQSLFEEKATEKRISLVSVLDEDATAVDVEVGGGASEGHALCGDHQGGARASSGGHRTAASDPDRAGSRAGARA